MASEWDDFEAAFDRTFGKKQPLKVGNVWPAMGQRDPVSKPEIGDRWRLVTQKGNGVEWNYEITGFQGRDSLKLHSKRHAKGGVTDASERDEVVSKGNFQRMLRDEDYLVEFMGVKEFDFATYEMRVGDVWLDDPRKTGWKVVDIDKDGRTMDYVALEHDTLTVKDGYVYRGQDVKHFVGVMKQYGRRLVRS